MIMKRICLISSSLALAVLAPTLASAEPGILYIPTDPVTLRPLSMSPCGSQVNSALGCGGASAETEEDPYADAAGLTTAISDALIDYDVLVTNTRPPEYISYTMLLASDEAADMNTGFTCTYGGISCSARQRARIISTSGSTMNCMDPEITHAVLYQFGRISGLEGVDNPMDVMNYVPDYTMAPVGYLDECSDRVQQNGFDDQGAPVLLPLECTSVDHFVCPNGANGSPGQNSHQDLLAAYGDRTDDADAPVLENIVPEDGAVIMAGEDVTMDVDVTDADPAVGLRWTISSPALEAAGVEGGMFSQCTNDVCDANWEDATPLKATDSDWSFTLAGLPPGEYTITLEASDYHGNVAEMVTSIVTIEGAGSDTGGADTGADETGTVDPTNGSNFTSGADSGDDDGSGSTAGTDDGGGGCSCTSGEDASGGGPSAVLMLLGFAGLGAMRRRR